mmetsp:Transcript_13156/g.50342  ORF Transcript_13156/g.50342 Transcript_13156/m.50342 type:complete len:399 (+) Transcript_13156:1269-2465(+)
MAPRRQARREVRPGNQLERATFVDAMRGAKQLKRGERNGHVQLERHDEHRGRRGQRGLHSSHAVEKALCHVGPEARLVRPRPAGHNPHLVDPPSDAAVSREHEVCPGNGVEAATEHRHPPPARGGRRASPVCHCLPNNAFRDPARGGTTWRRPVALGGCARRGAVEPVALARGRHCGRHEPSERIPNRETSPRLRLRRAPVCWGHRSRAAASSAAILDVTGRRPCQAASQSSDPARCSFVDDVKLGQGAAWPEAGEEGLASGAAGGCLLLVPGPRASFRVTRDGAVCAKRYPPSLAPASGREQRRRRCWSSGLPAGRELGCEQRERDVPWRHASPGRADDGLERLCRAAAPRMRRGGEHGSVRAEVRVHSRVQEGVARKAARPCGRIVVRPKGDKANL